MTGASGVISERRVGLELELELRTESRRASRPFFFLPFSLFPFSLFFFTFFSVQFSSACWIS